MFPKQRVFPTGCVVLTDFYQQLPDHFFFMYFIPTMIQDFEIISQFYLYSVMLLCFSLFDLSDNTQLKTTVKIFCCSIVLSDSLLVSLFSWCLMLLLLEPGLHLSEYLTSSCLHLVLTASSGSDQITSSTKVKAAVCVCVCQ